MLWRPVTALGGPLHGTGYLAVIAVVLLLPGAPRAATLLALVPGIGGWAGPARRAGSHALTLTGCRSGTPAHGSRGGR
jgi:hypothetical protein